MSNLWGRVLQQLLHQSIVRVLVQSPMFNSFVHRSSTAMKKGGEQASAHVREFVNPTARVSDAASAGRQQAARQGARAGPGAPGQRAAQGASLEERLRAFGAALQEEVQKDLGGGPGRGGGAPR